MLAEDQTDEALATRPTALAPDLYKDRIVVISGGGSGIGRNMAWLAARLGAQVIITGRKVEKLEGVQGALKAGGFPCEIAAFDTRDRAGVDAFIAGVFERHGRIDLQVNNAGGHFPARAIDISEKGFRSVVENNLVGAFNMMQSAARQWRDTGQPGVIVNITMSMRGLGDLSHSVASRAGIIAFTQSAAVEWAEFGIRMNCVSPGAIATEIWGEHERGLYGQNNPQRRAASGWDIAEAVMFVGSPAASFFNAADLIVDGGLSQWGESWPGGKPQHLIDASRAWDPEMQRGDNNDLMWRWRR